MKRDLDLIRGILLAIEKSPWSQIYASSLVIDDVASEAIIYNAFLAWDAGFVEAGTVSAPSGNNLLIRRMTFDGHDFLDMVRADEQWSTIRQMAQDSSIELTVEAVKRIAAKLNEAALSEIAV